MTDWLMEFMERFVLPILLVAMLVLLFVVFPYLLYRLYKESNDPNATTTLLNREWECVESHMVSSTTYVQSGKALVPITTTRRVCDTYKRK